MLSTGHLHAKVT